MNDTADPSAKNSPEEAQGPDKEIIRLSPVLHAPMLSKNASKRRFGWDGLLTVLVLVLAFLSASFLARNSDLWFHLATGRMLAQGDFSFGTDPFAYTTHGVYWTCHSWLFDLGFYKLFDLVGGSGLVVIKALLVSALAGLLLRIRNPGSSIRLPIVGTTLAILAMSPRLLLQPICVSYVFLGMTFWLLWKPHRDKLQIDKQATSSQARVRYLPLLGLFTVWVNVDEWFFLGPTMAALFWLGERLQGQRLTPGWLIPAGLAACLLSPHTFHVFTLPSELSAVPRTSGLEEDVRYHALFASPWSSEYLSTSLRNPAALAYFALTVLGLVSFVVHRQSLWSWRFIVWLPFALLAAWHARTISFFAIVGAPIAVLNGQDFLAARLARNDGGRKLRSPFLHHLSAALLSLGLLGLICFVWIGWQVGAGREERHVAWGVQADPSLQQVAETLHDWRLQGLLNNGERIFAISPEVSQYGAWFCPGEEHFLDHRYPLFPGAARDFETVCQALLPDLAPSPSGKPGTKNQRAGDWQRVLRENGVSVIVFYDRDPQRLFSVLRKVADDRKQWTLLGVAGQALIVGWNESRPAAGFSTLAFDADKLAFGIQDEQAQRALPLAPEEGPTQLPTPPNLWARLTPPHPPCPVGSPRPPACICITPMTVMPGNASARYKQP